MKTTILPLFDSMENLHKNADNAILPDVSFRDDFIYALKFIQSYTGSLGTFNSYRRETERLLQWSWLIKKCSITALKREDIEQFVHFCQNPPSHWISLKKVHRYVENNGLRQPNPAWRPFVATITKSARKQGSEPAIERFQLSQGATQEIFAILSSLFNFLISEEYLIANPVALIRQKSKFIRKQQHNAPIRRLSLLQWQTIMNVTDTMAQESPHKHERTYFILSLLFGMYLRISEVCASERWIPTMNDFSKDSNGHWWFTTVGKGNKKRQIAVSDAMLASLARWRQFLGLSPLPTAGDNTPLIPKIRGHGPMSDTAPIRRLVQLCFDRAAEQLRLTNQNEEADNLACATVHWLRHTGISEDVKTRPREHVRDDAGHSSSATTDRYIDIELAARHRSARNKKITNEMIEE
ncbi:MAG: integrase [Legionellales bacterium RIFCSPHIGHO2_12_FULL_42_9]|nr:MAG: integrase [Legionellales bacterium RIFCSPHIGHO2_12_FULL_42_9]